MKMWICRGMRVKLNFAKANADACDLRAILDLGANSSLRTSWLL